MKKWNFITFQSLLITLCVQKDVAAVEQEQKLREKNCKVLKRSNSQSTNMQSYNISLSLSLSHSNMHKCTHSVAISKWNFLIYTHSSQHLNQSRHDFVQHVSILKSVYKIMILIIIIWNILSAATATSGAHILLWFNILWIGCERQE